MRDILEDAVMDAVVEWSEERDIECWGFSFGLEGEIPAGQDWLVICDGWDNFLSDQIEYKVFGKFQVKLTADTVAVTAIPQAGQ